MSRDQGKKSSSGIPLGVIATIIVACIGAVGTISVAYIQFVVQPSLSLKATQTAELFRLTQAKLDESATTQQIEASPLPPPTNTPPITTTAIPPTFTLIPTNTPIPTPTVELVSRRLLKWSGGFIPDLITSWEISDDGTQIIYSLEPNVVMADGNPFNASVAREKIIEELGPGTDIDIIDDYTLILNQGIPSASVTSDIMEMISTIDVIVRK